MTVDGEDAEKKAQALLKFALGHHNAKRYNEAAGVYEIILKRHPDTEAVRFAESNLSNLVNKIDWLDPVPPDEEALKQIEALQALPTPLLDAVSPPAPTARLPKPESKPRSSPVDPAPVSPLPPPPLVPAPAAAPLSTVPAVRSTAHGPMPVVVVDIHMPFWPMVRFMVKAAFAAIPALIITTLILWMLLAVFARGFKNLL